MTRRIAGLIILVCTVAFCISAAEVEQFIMKDGRAIEGRVIGEDDTTYKVRTENGMETLRKDSVAERKKIVPTATQQPASSELKSVDDADEIPSARKCKEMIRLDNVKGLETTKHIYREHPWIRQDLTDILKKHMGADAQAFFKEVSEEDRKKDYAWRMNLPFNFSFSGTATERVFQILGEYGNIKTEYDASMTKEDREKPVTSRTSDWVTLENAFKEFSSAAGVRLRIDKAKECVVISKGPDTSTKTLEPALKERLNTKTSVQFTKTPGTEAIEFLRNLTKMGIVITPTALPKMQKLLDYQVKDISIKDLLKKITRDTGTSWVEKGTFIEFR
jgi:hypothetical protein